MFKNCKENIPQTSSRAVTQVPSDITNLCTSVVNTHVFNITGNEAEYDINILKISKEEICVLIFESCVFIKCNLCLAQK